MEIIGEHQERVKHRKGREDIEHTALRPRNPGGQTAHVGEKEGYGRHEYVVAIPKIADHRLRVRGRHELCQPHQDPADRHEKERQDPFPHGRLIEAPGQARLPQDQEK